MLKYDNVLVTPETAKAWMTRNTNNYRKIYPDTVHSYARIMKQGLWRNNGQAIVFDEDGALKDGQHRLLAVIESGESVLMTVVHGVSRDIKTWDEGKTRHDIDHARAENIDLKTAEISVINLVLGKLSTHIKIGSDEKIQYGKKHYNELKKAALFCGRGEHGAIMKKSGCMAAVYCAIKLGLMKDSEIETFCRIVNTGIPQEGAIFESAIMLKKTLEDHSKGELAHSTRRDMKSKFECTWQALVAYKEGRKTRRRFVPNGCAVEVIDAMNEKIAKEEVA